MNRSRQPRTPSHLSESILRQLNTYAIAAGAAGVSVLALAQPTEAKIVYTPAHAVVGRPFPIDLNHDGITDFYLLHVYSHFRGKLELWACQVISSNTAGPFCRAIDSTNQIRMAAGNFEAALRYGARIQRGDRFDHAVPLGGVSFFNGTYWLGPWFNEGRGVKNRYLGVKFKIKGQFHFGWMRITVTTTRNRFTATLTGYAYETIPGKAIVAGHTKGPDDNVERQDTALTAPTATQASLGMLALGVDGVALWRRKESLGGTFENN